METDRAVLAARIRRAHLSVLPSFATGMLPSFATGALDDSTTIAVAEALATENITLTVAITCRRFAVGPRRWDPAATGTVVTVTVTVTSTDTETGARRHVQLREPEAWARAVFAEFDDDAQWIYLLGGINPDTGLPEHGRTVYRLYLDEDAAPIRVPTQTIDTPRHWIGALH